jgi:hypothetical protein
LGITG